MSIEKEKKISELKLKLESDIVKFALGTGTGIFGMLIAPTLITTVGIAGVLIIFSISKAKEINQCMNEIDRLRSHDFSDSFEEFQNNSEEITISQEEPALEEKIQQPEIFPEGVRKDNIYPTILKQVEQYNEEMLRSRMNFLETTKEQAEQFLEAKKAFINNEQIDELKGFQCSRLMLTLMLIDETDQEIHERLNVMLTAIGINKIFNETGKSNSKIQDLVNKSYECCYDDPKDYADIINGKKSPMNVPENLKMYSISKKR